MLNRFFDHKNVGIAIKIMLLSSFEGTISSPMCFWAFQRILIAAIKKIVQIGNFVYTNHVLTG